MRLLLDTHALIWWCDGGKQLSPEAFEAIADGHNEAYFSIASAWEMAIKTSLGKLQLQVELENFYRQVCEKHRFQPLRIEMDDCLATEPLPFHHRDPFDRLLVAQSLRQKLALVSRDEVFDLYGVARIW